MVPKNSYNFTTLMKLGMTNLAAVVLLCGALNVVQAQAVNPSAQDSIAPTDSTAKVPVNDVVNDLVDFAQTFLGTPYKWAGTTPSGFDCSGFIYYIMGNFGFSITRTSYGMAELGKTVKLSEVQPGDLLFFKGRNLNSNSVGHVGMVIEVSEAGIIFIHASTSRGVTTDNLKKSSYYVPRFLKAKRMDYGINLLEED